jgi:hypothetical protein
MRGSSPGMQPSLPVGDYNESCGYVQAHKTLYSPQIPQSIIDPHSSVG